MVILARFAMRASRVTVAAAPSTSRSLGTTTRFLASSGDKGGKTEAGKEASSATNHRRHPNADEYGQSQKDLPTGPHMTNTTSTIANEVPRVGADKAPPELISAVDGSFAPADHQPENTERMTGGTQAGTGEGSGKDLGVGEMEGVSFKVEPKRRSGEDLDTMRARLLYQSRKRGCLESDLLLSTFASENLGRMSGPQLAAYDSFLDENDWDIYYWATQQAPPTSHETAEGGSVEYATPAARDHTTSGPSQKLEPVQPSQGEWAQTIGTFKAKYKPVPARWKSSEILSMLRKHVVDRSAGGVHESQPGVGGEGLAQSIRGTGGGGLGRMPDLQ